MAVDSRAKRLSFLNFGDGNNLYLLPDPDGTIDAADRLTLLDLYGGIAAGTPLFDIPWPVPPAVILTPVEVVGY